jgi:hypothetical protein
MVAWGEGSEEPITSGEFRVSRELGGGGGGGGMGDLIQSAGDVHLLDQWVNSEFPKRRRQEKSGGALPSRKPPRRPKRRPDQKVHPL